MDVIAKLIQRAKDEKQRIVLPEGTEERTLTAADRAIADQLADIVLLGDSDEIMEQAQKLGLTHISPNVIINPRKAPDLEEFAQTLAELRKRKGLTLEEAREKIKDPLYYGCMMIKMGKADGQLAGARNATSNVLRPALQIIKTAPGITCAKTECW